MRVLVGCEESQAVTKELRKLGHEAFSCDIQECSGGHPEWHYQRDIFEVINMGWDMMIAHPPCTYLALTGQWMLKENLPHKFREGVLTGAKRQKAREDSIKFFIDLYNCNIPLVCLENPRSCISSQFRKPDQIIHPYYFGDPAQKATCLWLKGLPLLKHYMEDDLINQKTWVDVEMITMKSGKKINKWFADSGKVKIEERSKSRSKTFPGIAKAIAEQWGGILKV